MVERLSALCCVAICLLINTQPAVASLAHTMPCNAWIICSLVSQFFPHFFLFRLLGTMPQIKFRVNVGHEEEILIPICHFPRSLKISLKLKTTTTTTTTKLTLYSTTNNLIQPLILSESKTNYLSDLIYQQNLLSAVCSLRGKRTTSSICGWPTALGKNI